MTLLVVLLSAAPTGEQAFTRLVGSAFDPAAASVALGPKLSKTKAPAIVKRTTEDSELAPPPALVWSAPESVLPELAPERSPGAAAVVAGSAPRAFARAHRSRAPPSV